MLIGGAASFSIFRRAGGDIALPARGRALVDRAARVEPADSATGARTRGAAARTNTAPSRADGCRNSVPGARAVDASGSRGSCEAGQARRARRGGTFGGRRGHIG